MANQVTINGKTYNLPLHRQLTIQSNQIYLDGELWDGDESPDLTNKIIVELHITGNPVDISSEAPVTVKGNVLGSVTSGGPVTCKDVTGDVSANGPITCKDVGGNADAAGPMTCGNVTGNATARGPMSRR